MQIYHGIEQARYQNKHKSIAFIPTMGCLHAGHTKLIKVARSLAKTVVVSIFVNPLQFGINEDFERYPRTLDDDKKLLLDAGVDHLLLPGNEDIYPHGQEQHTQVYVPQLSQLLCGKTRENHFRGVATIVLKLLLAITPKWLLLGEKDYQQICIIQRMIKDLLIPTEIVAVPTVREADGLALSTRNRYLSQQQRKIAPMLYQSLLTAQQQWQSGERNVKAIEDNAIKQLSTAFSTVDYWSICNAIDLTPLANDTQQQKNNIIICGCVSIGNTRLIDNIKCATL